MRPVKGSSRRWGFPVAPAVALGTRVRGQAVTSILLLWAATIVVAYKYGYKYGHLLGEATGENQDWKQACEETAAEDRKAHEQEATELTEDEDTTDSYW